MESRRSPRGTWWAMSEENVEDLGTTAERYYV
jgi:hypothetical protein